MIVLNQQPSIAQGYEGNGRNGGRVHRSILTFWPFASWTTASGNVITTKRELFTSFEEIEVHDCVHLVVEQGSELSVKVICDDNLIEHLTTEVRDNKLVIGLPTLQNWTYTRQEVHLTLPKSQRLSTVISFWGSTCEFSTPFHTDSLNVIMMSGSSCIMNGGRIQSLYCAMTGAGTRLLTDNSHIGQLNLKLSGVGIQVVVNNCIVGQFDANVSGNGARIDAYSSPIEQAVLNCSGVGNSCDVFVNTELRASVSGVGGVIRYKGNAVLHEHSSGVGTRVLRVE